MKVGLVVVCQTGLDLIDLLQVFLHFGMILDVYTPIILVYTTVYKMVILE